MTEWKVMAASAVGTSHLSTEIPCQDYLSYDFAGHDTLILCCADGAGSAAHSAEAAKHVCETFISDVKTEIALSESLDNIDERWSRKWMMKVGGDLEALAKERECDGREFSCTFLGAVVTDSEYALLQVGDGGIVFATSEGPDDYTVFTWPQKGEYANETVFVINRIAPAETKFTRARGQLTRLALFTDGLEMLALDFTIQAAFKPFFAPLYDWLRGSEDPSEDRNRALKSFLGSNDVNARTDDDKTLIVALR